MPLPEQTLKFEKIGWRGSRLVMEKFSSRARCRRRSTSSASVVRQSKTGGREAVASGAVFFGMARSLPSSLPSQCRVIRSYSREVHRENLNQLNQQRRNHFPRDVGQPEIAALEFECKLLVLD